MANNLEPTLNFYIDALGDESKALGLVIRISCIYHSLETRLKRWLEEEGDAGLIINARCLKSIAKYSKKKWYAACVVS